MSTTPTPEHARPDGPDESSGLTRIDRRTLLLGSGALVLLAACGSRSGGTGSDDAVKLTPDDGGRILVANFNFQGGYLVPGIEQRLSFVLASADGAFTTDTPDSLTFTLTADGTPVGEPITVARHADGVPVPYYPLRTTFPASGVYKATVDIDGRSTEQASMVSEAAQVTLLQPGSAMRAVATPTVADPRGVTPICTRDPQCPLHDHSLTEVLAQPGPVALLVATPAFCQTGTCGPVLDLLLEARASRPDVRFVHAEVYTDPNKATDLATATLTPAVTTYGLDFEPSLFLAAADGTLTVRLDNTFDRQELAAGLSRIS